MDINIDVNRHRAWAFSVDVGGEEVQISPNCLVLGPDSRAALLCPLLSLQTCGCATLSIVIPELYGENAGRKAGGDRERGSSDG